jgi:hypothetical protein
VTIEAPLGALRAPPELPAGDSPRPSPSAGWRPQPKGVGAELASARGSPRLGGGPSTGGGKLLPYTFSARGATVPGSSRPGDSNDRVLTPSELEAKLLLTRSFCERIDG